MKTPEMHVIYKAGPKPKIVKRGKVYLVGHPSGAWIATDMRDSAERLVELWQLHDACFAALKQIIQDGNYDDDGDFILYHRAPKRGDEDYLDPPAIEQARKAISMVEKGE